jgi:large subunit ribosomal protein L9
MKIILVKDVPGLGFKNDTVKIKNGYGRNFLIPNGFAILANESNTKSLNELLKQTKNKQEEIINNAKELAKKIGELNIEIPVKVGSEDKMFGSITTNQISKLLSEKGFDIDKKNISFSNKVKNLGIYDVNLIIHKEITHPIKINIIAKKAAKKKEIK